ncbi:peptidase M28 [Achromatium sp. WMS3]|nr:peptidase M28 [Achromatium sp. WMS3]
MSNLQHSVNFLTDIRPYRHYDNVESLDKVASFIENQFKDYGLATKMQIFNVEGEQYKNIIATYGQKTEEKIVIGAHYDVCGNQTGADDNASAVAGLLEIARLFALHNLASKYQIEFVAYSLEEPPFFGTDNMGSYIHAKSLHDNREKINCMICLEMIGYFTDKENSQNYPIEAMKAIYPTIGNFIAVVGNSSSGSLVSEITTHIKAASINVQKLEAPVNLPGIDFSDHRNYWYFGYKAVMITDSAFYRNPHYHRASDTADTLDYAKMGEVVKGITWALLNKN